MGLLLSQGQRSSYRRGNMAEEDTLGNKNEAFSPFAIMNNNNIIEFCRTSLAAMAGISAGILGLGSLRGFIFYFLASLVMSVLICWKAGSEWRKYFVSWWDLSTAGILGGISTYLLFWTFLYGMVHVY